MIFNKLLSINPACQNLLKKNIGKSFTIQLVGIRLNALIDSDGSLINPIHNTYDTIINIPIQSTTYLINQDKLATFKSITIAGNKNFGRALLETFAKLNLNGIYANKSPISGFLIIQLENIFNLIKNQMKLMNNNATHSISEYLLYESQDIATKYEIEKFCDEVDSLRSKTDRLTLQIKRLVKQT